MKLLKVFTIMLAAMCMFTACEEEKEKEKEPKLSDYVDFRVTSCERFGEALRIDYTVTNVSKKALQNIGLVKQWNCYDDLSVEYGFDIGINGGRWMEEVYFNLQPEETANGSFVIREYDSSNTARRFNLIAQFKIDDMTFFPEIKNIPIKDNRNMQNSFVDPDPALQVTLQSCTRGMNELGWWEPETECAFVNFTIKNTSSRNIRNVNLTGASVKDNMSQDYPWKYFSLEGGDYQGEVTLSLAAGETANVTLLVYDLDPYARTLTGEIGCRSDSYPITDTALRFYDVNIEN